MQPLTEAILEGIPNGVFTYAEVACLVEGSRQKLHGLAKRANRIRGYTAIADFLDKYLDGTR